MIEAEALNLSQAKVLLEVKDPESQVKGAQLAQKLNLNANELKGRMQQQIKAKPAGDSREVGVVSLDQLTRSLVNLYEALQGYDFTMLNDLDKRSALKKQISLIQKKLTAIQASLENTSPVKKLDTESKVLD